MTTLPAIETVYGIDFSGAEKPGSLIWITEATPQDHGIRITNCRSAKDLLKLQTPHRDAVLPKLVRFVADRPNAVFGCDFPFSLPAHLVEPLTWKEFVKKYPECFRTPEAFQQYCNQANLEKYKKKEVQRETEKRWRECIPVNNLRMFKMTHFGIRSFLRPLVLEHGASVPPLTDGASTAPLVLEVFGTGTCINLDIDLTSSKQNPGKSLRHLESLGRVSFVSDCLRDTVLGSPDHALDSVIAADAAFRAVSDPAHINSLRKPPYTVEGHIFA